MTPLSIKAMAYIVSHEKNIVSRICMAYVKFTLHFPKLDL